EFFAVGIGSYGVWRWLSQRHEPIAMPRILYALLVPVIFLVAKKNPAIALWLTGMFVLANVHFGNRARISRAAAGLLNCAPAQFLGRISYPLYLLHVPALVFVRQ